MFQIHPQFRRIHGFAIVLIAIGVSFVAAAQTSDTPANSPNPTEPSPVAPETAPAHDAAQAADKVSPVTSPAQENGPDATAVATLPETKPAPWHGSSFSYGHSISVMTLSPSGDPYYDPTWAQNLTLMPEWHFNDLFFTRARMFISQEFTDSDTTNTRHEFELSDIYLDVGTTGYQETHTGLRLSGDVRFVLPTSKLSQFKTQILTIGPSLALSRKFDILSGLTLGYGVRGTGHINKYTTRQIQSNPYAGGGSACAGTAGVCDPTAIQAEFDAAASASSRDPGADPFANVGLGNVFFDIGHGPSISFQPYETVSIDATFLMARAWVYAVAAPPGSVSGSNQLGNVGTQTRDVTRFVLSASWQFTKPVGVAVTALTINGSQLGADGKYNFPLFNRNTTLYLDFSVDVEAVTSKFF